MITLKPIDDKQKTEEFFIEKGLEFNENSGVLLADNNGEILGFCLYLLKKESITILEIEPKDDLSLLDGVLRSTLHLAANRNIADAYYVKDEEIFKKLGFIKDENNKTLKIEKLFESCCSCN